MRYASQPIPAPSERPVQGRWAPADDSDLRQRYLAGDRVMEIAVAIDRTPQAVAVRAARLRIHRPKALNAAQEIEALRRLAAGETQSSVAALLGVNQSRISRLFRKRR